MSKMLVTRSLKALCPVSINNKVTMPVRIIYASQARSDLRQSDIDEVVRLSVIKNGERGITGVLAFDGNQIVQILEGPQEAIENLYGRIQVDCRHQGVVTLANHEIDRPHFPDWTMVKRSIVDVLLLVNDLNLGSRGKENKELGTASTLDCCPPDTATDVLQGQRPTSIATFPPVERPT
ncbi:MAG: BLUF domain-containing protein [Alphaproteobacteria bacterium]|nr:MAG: BLUF domain-containing protein [Alphaproteobacteria bacterium]